jgi:ABC-type glycerol-3-phosphate transport system substrate-binding protein
MKRLMLIVGPIIGIIVIWIVLAIVLPGPCKPGGDNYPACLCDDDDEACLNPPEATVIDLEFWNLYDDRDAFSGQFQAYQQQFRSENNGSTLRINYRQFNNEEQYEKLLLNHIAEGGGPDIFAMHHSWLPRHKKKIAPLPESKMLIEDFKTTFFKAAEQALIHPDEEGIEQIYGLPMFIDSLALFYNQKIFDGIFRTTPWPGETWEEIEVQVRTLSAQDNSPERFELSGIAMGRTDNISLGVDIINLIMVQYGIDILNDDTIAFSQDQGTEPDTGKKVVPAERAFERFYQFTRSNSILYSWNRLLTGMDVENKELTTFLRGKTAMIFGYSSTYSRLQELNEELLKAGVDDLITGGRNATLDNSVGIAKAPQLLAKEDRGQDEKNGVYLAEMYPLTVSKNSIFPDESWDLLMYLTQTESMMKYNEVTNKPISRRDIGDENSAMGTNELYSMFAQQTPYAVILPMFHKHDYRAIINDAILSLNKKKVENAVKQAESRLQCVFDKIKDNAELSDADCTKIGGR